MLFLDQVVQPFSHCISLWLDCQINENLNLKIHFSVKNSYYSSNPMLTDLWILVNFVLICQMHLRVISEDTDTILIFWFAVRSRLESVKKNGTYKILIKRQAFGFRWLQFLNNWCLNESNEVICFAFRIDSSTCECEYYFWNGLYLKLRHQSYLECTDLNSFIHIRKTWN